MFYLGNTHSYILIHKNKFSHFDIIKCIHLYMTSNLLSISGINIVFYPLCVIKIC